MRYWRPTVALVVSLLLAQPTFAERVLSLYEATYKTTVSGIRVTLTRTLLEEAGRYHLRQAGKTFLLKLSEDSQFSLAGDQIVGEQFVYQLTGVSNRRREVLFDEGAGTIRSLRKKEWNEHPSSPEVLD